MRHLGIDFGTKKVGVALSDESGAMGFPQGVFLNDETLLPMLVRLITDKEVGVVVIGESLDTKGNENPVAQKAHAFGDALARLVPVRVATNLKCFQRKKHAETLKGTVRTEMWTLQPQPLYLPRIYLVPMITIDDLSKIDVRVGTVLSAEHVPETDKLLRLVVDLGEETPRQIVSGIARYVADPASLVGRQLSFVANLAPRTIKGLESNGMLFATGAGDTFAFLVPDRPVPPGTGAH